MANSEVQKRELRDRIGMLVRERFEGDYRKAFNYYAQACKDGKITRHELAKLLADAGVGNWLTRSAWASGIIAKLDVDKDGNISKAEFEDALPS